MYSGVPITTPATVRFLACELHRVAARRHIVKRLRQRADLFVIHEQLDTRLRPDHSEPRTAIRREGEREVDRRVFARLDGDRLVCRGLEAARLYFHGVRAWGDVGDDARRGGALRLAVDRDREMRNGASLRVGDVHRDLTRVRQEAKDGRAGHAHAYRESHHERLATSIPIRSRSSHRGDLRSPIEDRGLRRLQRGGSRSQGERARHFH
jgi:hypothetical protein